MEATTIKIHRTPEGWVRFFFFRGRELRAMTVTSAVAEVWNRWGVRASHTRDAFTLTYKEIPATVCRPLVQIENI